MFNKNKINEIVLKLRKYIGDDLVTIFSHAKNYFFSTVVLKAAAFITIPLFTRYLTTEEYGIVSLFHSYVGIVIIVFPFYLYSAVGRYYYERKDDLNIFIGTALSLSISAFVFSLILYLSLDLSFLSFGHQDNTLIYLLFLAVPLKIIVSIYFQIIVPQRNSKLYAKLQILEGYINIVFSVGFVVLLSQKKYYGQIYGVIISSSVIFIYAIFQLKKIVKFSIKLSHIKYILLFSLPQIPYALGGVILEQVGRLILGSQNKYSDLGIYSLGFQIAVLYSFLATSIRTALLPDFYRLLDTFENQKLTLLFRKILAISVLPAFFLISFSRDMIYLLADKKFYSSHQIVPFLVIGYVCFDLFYVYSPYFEYKKHTWVLSLIVISCGILNIIMNYYLINIFGYIGSGYSFAISYSFMFILTWSILKIFYNLQITKITIIIKPILILVGFTLFLFITDMILQNSICNFTTRMILFIGFIGTNYYLNIKNKFY